MAHDALQMVEYSDDPAVFIIGDGEAATERARRTAAIAHCRAAAAEPVDGAAERVRSHAAVNPLFVELESSEEPDRFVPLLDFVRGEAEARGRRSVIVAPFELTDLVAARAWHANIELLTAPTELQRVTALVAATRPQPMRLNDVGREDNALLQQLSEEVGRIATILASLSEDEASEPGTKAAAREAEEASVDAAYVRALIRARRLRDQYFRSELFADPAWDMLLDLMAARLEGRRVAVSSLCIAAAVPATTALRWIKALTERALFVRSADPEDGRRVYIELSDSAAASLTAYLRAVQRIAPSVI